LSYGSISVFRVAKVKKNQKKVNTFLIFLSFIRIIKLLFSPQPDSLSFQKFRWL